MKIIVYQIIVLLLILLFTYAAVSKLSDFAAFRGEMLNQSLPGEVAIALLIILPVAESTVAILLLIPTTQVRGLWLSMTLLSIFTAYIVLVLLGYWSRVPCSCGGVISHLNWHQHLVFNCFFLALNGIAVVLQRRTEIGAEGVEDVIRS